jgi:hypothetical protein
MCFLICYKDINISRQWDLFLFVLKLDDAHAFKPFAKVKLTPEN